MSISVPNAFTSVTTATGAQLDANFAVLVNWINNNSAVFQNAYPLAPAGKLTGSAPGSTTTVSYGANWVITRDAGGTVYSIATPSFSLVDLSIAASGIGSGKEYGLTLTNGTWYYPWLVTKSDGTEQRLILSASYTVPNLTGLTDADTYGLLSAVYYYNGTTKFRVFTQVGNRVNNENTTTRPVANAGNAPSFTSASFLVGAPAICNKLGGWNQASSTAAGGIGIIIALLNGSQYLGYSQQSGYAPASGYTYSGSWEISNVPGNSTFYWSNLNSVTNANYIGVSWFEM